MHTTQELQATLSILNPWWEDKNYRFNLKPRSSYETLIQSQNKNIDIFIGSRRVGKTSIMQNIINRLLSSRVNKRQIIYFSADARISRAWHLKISWLTSHYI